MKSIAKVKIIIVIDSILKLFNPISIKKRYKSGKQGILPAITNRYY